jgi:phosphohistidine phosphatase
MAPKPVVVMRHGEAEPWAGNDAERRLTKEGRAQAEAVSASIRQWMTPDVIFASPYVRAEETSRIVSQAFTPSVPVETLPILTPESDPRAVNQWCDSLSRSVILVSHMPLIGSLLQMLAGHSVAVGTANAFGLIRRVSDGKETAPRWRLALTARPFAEPEILEAGR